MRRTSFTGAALVAGAVAIACGGSTAGSPSGGTTGSACDDLFNALYASSCTGGPAYPADEIARIKPRFARVCASIFTLPGSGYTSGNIEACAQAIQSAGASCQIDTVDRGACATPSGTLANGAPCNTDAQCAGGWCGRPGGSCGTCEPALAVGQSCRGMSYPCVGGATCDNNGTGNCVAITYGDVGAACGTGGAQCQTGLHCDAAGHTCAGPGAAGAACLTSYECASGLFCGGFGTGAASGTCTAGGDVGAPCPHGTDDCANGKGLNCDASSQTCQQVVWARPGTPCKDFTQPCLVGSCPFGGSATVCPTIVADGQPCNASDPATTCDTFSSCVGGTCQLEYSTVCR
jgi:hypothetical protein